MKKKAKDQHLTFEKGATSEKLNSHSSQKFGKLSPRYIMKGTIQKNRSTKNYGSGKSKKITK